MQKKKKKLINFSLKWNDPFHSLGEVFKIVSCLQSTNTKEGDFLLFLVTLWACSTLVPQPGIEPAL